MHVKSWAWLALVAATPAAAVNWPQPGLNAAHTGYNKKETTLSAANIGRLRQKWATSVPNGIDASPVEAHGMAYVQSTDGTVYAVNAKTGAIIWTYAAGAPAVVEGVTSGANLVYSPCNVDTSGHGGICALSAATGTLVWSFSIITVQGQTVTSSYAENVPVIDHGKIFFAEVYGGFDSPYSGNNVYALDAATGAVSWGIAESTVDKSDGLPFAVANGRVFYQSGGANTFICAVNEADGTAMLCSAPVSGDGYVAISVAGGDVLAQSNDSSGSGTTSFTALDETTLGAVWQKSVAGITSDYSLYPPAVADGTAYFYAGENGFGSLYALALKTGVQRWSYECGGSAGCLNSGVSAANGVLYASCDRQDPEQGDQCAFDATTGAVLRVYGSTDGHAGTQATPLVANGAEISACGGYAGNLCKFVP